MLFMPILNGIVRKKVNFLFILSIYRAGIALLRSRWFMFRARNKNVPRLFTEVTAQHPNKVAIYYKDEKWTFQMVDEFANRVANSFLSLGFRPGDEVALVMNSRPEFIAIWLGMAKCGIVTAFINTNQRMETLAHSITVVRSKAVLFDSSLTKSGFFVLSSYNNNILIIL